MSNVTRELKAFAEKKWNVILKGEAGVGKTFMVAEVFDELYGPNNWVHVSGATIDPYVDFVGLPYAEENAEGVKKLGFLRPDMWKDNVRAIFIDELNRADRKVVNAALELIQFKSVNGMATNVEVVWAAINPDDKLDETGKKVYQVSSLDPAHLDRFHAHFDIPCEPDREVFSRMFGKDIAKAVIEYWNNLDTKSRNRIGLSPRRLEYAVRVFQDGLSVERVINNHLNPGDLTKRLSAVSVSAQFHQAIAAGDTALVRRLVNGANGQSVWGMASTDFEIQAVLGVISDDRVGTLVQDPRYNVLVADKTRREELVDILSTESYAESDDAKVAKINDWIDKNDISIQLDSKVVEEIKKKNFKSSIFSKPVTDEVEASQLMIATAQALGVVLVRDGVGITHQEIVDATMILEKLFSAYPKLSSKRQIQESLFHLKNAIMLRSGTNSSNPDFTKAFESNSYENFHTLWPSRPTTMIKILASVQGLV